MSNYYPRLVEKKCEFLETVEMSFLNGKITDANIAGKVNLKFKSDSKLPEKKKSKVVPIELLVEDSRWHTQTVFDVTINNEKEKI